MYPVAESDIGDVDPRHKRNGSGRGSTVHVLPKNAVDGAGGGAGDVDGGQG